MYNSGYYGYGVYKRNQVTMGKPYQISNSVENTVAVADPGLKNNEDTEKKAADILARAREEAGLIIRQAQLEANSIIEKARAQAVEQAEEISQRAKEEGYRKGELQAQQHYQELIAEAEEYRNRSVEEYEQTIRSLEHDIVELALSIARKILESELETDKDTILKIAKSAIDACLNHDRIILRVSPEDYDYVTMNAERIKNMAGDIGELEVRKDSTLKKGSCIVDTGYGMVDGGLDTRLEMIEQAFREVMGDRYGNEQQ